MILTHNIQAPWNEIAITADPHYHHKNLVRGCSSWDNKDGCRDFDTLQEHDDLLVKNINKVAKGKILYCLGDWSFGGIHKIGEFYNRLEAKEIHLIVGNHDHHLISNTDDCRAPFTSVNAKGFIIINGQRIVFNHFPERVWNKSHKNAWMLHGHSHGNLRGKQPYYEKSKTMDVGIDTHPLWQPYLGTEIKEEMDKRGVIKIDHH